MFDFTITSGVYSFYCIIWHNSQRRRVSAERGNFSTLAAAELWATSRICELERKAQEFADDPITQYYGL